jgi:predicted TIM-barrel fold metal-dependent hydrolase
MIIDAHVHITDNGRWFHTDYDASLNRLIKSMDEAKVEKAIILPISPYISNKFVYSVCKKFPEKFFGFASVDPQNNLASTLLKADVREFCLCGLKLHPRLQHFSLNNKNFQHIVTSCIELNIPILLDAFFREKDIQAPEFIDHVAHIAKHNPDVSLIIAHAGGLFFKETICKLEKYQNIFFDLSFILEYLPSEVCQQELMPLCYNIGADRLIFGSDFPEKNLHSYLIHSTDLFSNFFMQSEQKMIFQGTISKLIN